MLSFSLSGFDLTSPVFGFLTRWLLTLALLLSSMALENNFMLEPTDAKYGGVVIDADRLPADKAGLARSLTASLSHWKSVVRLGPHF